ncbi:MAG: hypothetical protein KatS3mg077_3080 [Candidatus Binatia bacterium]|nr:MAG: hypothetical protein KatS3mg077_3080 [Candidatus Binatia bacterium]
MKCFARPRLHSGIKAALALPFLLAVKALLHGLALHRDDWFRDELYYLACARRLDWSYVDHPAFSIGVLHLLREAGSSLIVLRLLALCIACLTLFLASRLARDVGAGQRAQAWTVFALAFAPGFLALHSFYSMNVWEPLFWVLAARLWVRIAAEGKPAHWYLLAAVFVLGFHNKLSMLWFALPSLAGAYVQFGKSAHTRWGILLVGLALCFGAIPWLWWQISHGWPTLEFMRNATQLKMAHVSFLDFWTSQLLVFGPLVVLLAISGAMACVFQREFRPRCLLLGVSFLAVAALLSFSGSSRAYYLAPAYTIVIPIGAAALVRWASKFRVPARAQLVVLGAFFLPSLAGIPLALPVLGPDATVSYAATLHIPLPREERFGESELPQHLADRYGWQELASAVLEAVASLPPDVREKVTVIATNYGEAAALEFYARGHPIATRIASPHNNYWYWARPSTWSEHFVTVGFPTDSLQSFCSETKELARVQCRWCRAGERGAVIAYCRYGGNAFQRDWARLRKFL